jgi:hypothetical protein
MSGMMCPMGKLYNRSSFTEYVEPDSWEEKYLPYQTEWKYKLNENTTKPITDITEEQLEAVAPNFDYKNIRNTVVEQSLDIDRVRCPIFNLFDSSIDYSNSARRIQQHLDEEAAKKPKSLFTVYRDDEQQEGALTDDGEEDN